MEIDAEQVSAFLVDQLGFDAGDVDFIGAGAWSECFGFTADGHDLVVRIGRHRQDFEKDRIARRYAHPTLPVPDVLATGRGLGGHYAISTRCTGSPLETVTADGWRRLLPAVSAALESLRTAPLTGTGWGRWDHTGNAPAASWREHLLTVEHDPPTGRLHGWSKKLAAIDGGMEAFEWALALLRGLDLEMVPRSLVHGDLINRNVHVDDDHLTGVFDWGCSLYGDHLYDLAWFEFWNPWHPQLDLDALRRALEDQWRAASYQPSATEERSLACCLHIGLDHLAYNAFIDEPTAVISVMDRLRAVVSKYHA